MFLEPRSSLLSDEQAGAQANGTTPPTANSTRRARARARTVLITAAHRGYGRQMALVYASKGWRVIAVVPTLDAMQAVKDLQIAAQILVIDFQESSSLRKAQAQMDALGAIDLVINNAGFYNPEEPLDGLARRQLLGNVEVMTSLLLWNLQQAVVLNGKATIAQITSRWPSIISSSSDCSYLGYHAPQAALHLVSKKIAKALKNNKIALILLHPGYTKHSTREIDVDRSIASMTRIISKTKVKDTGRFIHSEGNVLPW